MMHCVHFDEKLAKKRQNKQANTLAKWIFCKF